MKFLKIAALVALASLPLLFMNRKEEKDRIVPEVDTDDIFDEELSIG
jgi:hypothetical protein